MNNYETMSVQELNKELERLKTLLADTEEERGFVLGQSGNHVSGGFVKRFAEEIKNIQEDIDLVSRLISEKQ